MGIKDSQTPSIWCQRELFCCLLIVHGACQHNLALPDHPYLKLLGKHSQKVPCTTVEMPRHFMCLKMKGTLKQHTPNKLASKLKLPMNHKMHFLTLICDLLTTDTISSQASSALVLRGKRWAQVKDVPCAGGKDKREKRPLCFCSSPLENVSPPWTETGLQ